MASKHEYATTWESTDSDGNVVGSAELLFSYTYTPGRPQTWTDPADPAEIELYAVEQDVGNGWVPVTDVMPNGEKWADFWLDWVWNNYSDELHEHAKHELARGPED